MKDLFDLAGEPTPAGSTVLAGHQTNRAIDARIFTAIDSIADRAEKAAVIVTTNLPFSEWSQVIPNPRLCKALIDRLTDRAHIITTGTDSPLPPDLRKRGESVGASRCQAGRKRPLT